MQITGRREQRNEGEGQWTDLVNGGEQLALVGGATRARRCQLLPGKVVCMGCQCRKGPFDVALRRELEFGKVLGHAGQSRNRVQLRLCVRACVRTRLVSGRGWADVVLMQWDLRGAPQRAVAPKAWAVLHNLT